MKPPYVVTEGTSDAALASVPLHIAANGSLEVGQEVSVVLVGDATEPVIGDNARHVRRGGASMRELLSKLVEHRVPVYVRKSCGRGPWSAPPDVARLCAEIDKVLTLWRCEVPGLGDAGVFR